ncbi:MAG: hypothetical protein IJ480_04380 [Clostridia bacterium]|nr:hypothetical protein [Clostridia bacterium]
MRETNEHTIILGTDWSETSPLRRTVILGTDWWTDCDDAAAIRIACRADKAGLWHLSGVICNACMEYSAASLNAFLTSEGYGDLPLGIDLAAVDYGRNPPYQKTLAENLPHAVLSNEELPDGLALYLRLLEEAEGPAEILEIGYPQVLAALCAHPDGYRYLTEKVSCLWMMAGNWEKDGTGVENNFARGPRSRKAAAYLLEHCPCPIVFLGWETGASVISGKPETISDDPVSGGAETTDPLRMAFIAHGSRNGRSSWDPMLVLLALTNDVEKAGYTLRRGYASVDPETGENRFRYAKDGPHGYVVKTMPDGWYEEKLAQWLRCV